MVLEFTRDEVLIILTAKQSNPHEVSLNPLSPSIHIQILQTDPYTFPLRISRENLIKDQGILSCVSHFINAYNLSFDIVWIMLGEN